MKSANTVIRGDPLSSLLSPSNVMLWRTNILNNNCYQALIHILCRKHESKDLCEISALNIAVFQDATSCTLGERYQHFEETCSLKLPGSSTLSVEPQPPTAFFYRNHIPSCLQLIWERCCMGPKVTLSTSPCKMLK